MSGPVNFDKDITFFTQEDSSVQDLIGSRKGTICVEASSSKGFFDGIFDYINSRSIIRGASSCWDRTRLLTGKLAKLAEIGDTPVELKTTEGTRLAASHLYHDIFAQKVKENGGVLSAVEIEFNHPLAPRIKPAQILNQNTNEKLSEAAIIEYSPFLEPVFADLDSFQSFLSQARLIAVWEKSLEPVKTPVRSLLWNGSSKKDNIIILPLRFFDNELRKQPVKIEASSSFEHIFSDLFNIPNGTEDVIFFENESNPFVQALLNLKIEQTPWSLVPTSKGVFVLKKTSPIFNFLNNLDRFDNPLINIKIKEKTADQSLEASVDRGVVVMSMNQTNSYTQYTHEILTFLLSGMDVFAYDHAGKGLSEGSNSESGLLEAICLSGLYLKQVGYDESRIVFKGQCAGGIPTSAAPSFFPRSHVWIDQAPNSFSRVSVEIFKKMIEEKKDQSKLLNFFYRSLPLVEPIVSSLTKCLFPSIDVIENAARGSGLFIYSMGVPDQEKQGGDKLVPKEDVDAMIAKLGTLDKEAVFLPIVGGSHVTDWWIDPKLIEKVSRALKKQGLMHSNFGAV